MRTRNLILISFDTLRFDALSAAPDRRLLGDDADPACTPTLDRIASEGTFFSRAVTACPYTSPSHASIFTGTYWPKHGVLDLFGCQMRPEVEPLACALQRRGYSTGQNAGRGWRDGDMFAMDSVGLNRGYNFQAFGGWMRRKTLRWLRRVAGGTPWYLFFHTMAVHRPYGKSHRVCRRLLRRDIEAGTPFVNLRRLYLRNVSDVDRRFGRLWEQLRAGGMLDNTMVVITSDHGEGHSPHCTIHCNPGGWSESCCRVPLIFWAPGLVKAGQVVEEPISTLAVAPTIAELLGLDWEQPVGFDATSVADVVRGSAPPASLAGRECFVFGSMSAGPPPLMQAVVKDAGKYVSFEQATPGQWQELQRKAKRAAASRKKQSRLYNMTRLLRRYERGELELLFDVSEDPGETHNLAQERPEQLKELRTSMQAWYRRHHVEVADRVRMDERGQRDMRRRLRKLGYID